MLLYLCEKPSQAKDIAKVLGINKQEGTHFKGHSRTVVTWCVGHLLEMASPEYYRNDLKPWRLEALPIIPKEWKMNVVNKTKKQFNAIKKLLKDADEVIIATDADREGEVIAREILAICNYRGKLQRLWLSALDEVSIKKALANLKADHETRKLYDAGMARQRADWLVGMNLTMAATVLFGKKSKEVLTVGRVQTPTLKLVVDRDRAIEAFQPKNYYILQVQFITQQQENFWADWEVSPNLADEEGHCSDRVRLESVANKIKGKSAQVYAFEENQKHEKPPLGLSLSALQKLASSRLGISAKQTLDVVQSLYETHKATTYPRTDCCYLPESQFADAKIIVSTLKNTHPELKSLIERCDLTSKSLIWNDKKITAHHAIIPTTNVHVDHSRFSILERQIYDLICRKYLAQFLGDYVYLRRLVIINCEEEWFKTSCNLVVAYGWQLAIASHKPEEIDCKIAQSRPLIPVLKKNEKLINSQMQIDSCKTQSPARYTEGTVIDAMKNVGKYVTDLELRKILKDNAGIGTEATRANILEALFKRGYLVRQGKNLVSTSKGREIIDLLPHVISDPATTARWEQELEAIANGEQTLAGFMRQQIINLQMMLEELSAKLS